MIRVRAYNTHPRYHAGIKETLSLASAVLKREGVHDAELTVVFIHDKRMLDLNGSFLDHWYPTDVLSFPLHEGTGPGIEGEVYVNLDRARRQAKEYSISITQEIHRLVVHGILHLVGYRDDTRKGRQEMTSREDFYLNKKK
jgi:probable rRNA maturation factor